LAGGGGAAAGGGAGAGGGGGAAAARRGAGERAGALPLPSPIRTEHAVAASTITASPLTQVFLM
jgi:hypothetical protein